MDIRLAEDLSSNICGDTNHILSSKQRQSMLMNIQHVAGTQIMINCLPCFWCMFHWRPWLSVAGKNSPLALFILSNAYKLIFLKALEDLPHPPNVSESVSEGYVQEIFSLKRFPLDWLSELSTAV